MTIELDTLPIYATETSNNFSYGEQIVPMGDATELGIPRLIEQPSGHRASYMTFALDEGFIFSIGLS